MRTTLAEFLDDRVIYRSLDPLDPHLPRYAKLAERVGLSPDAVPRKCQPAYARVVGEILRAAFRLRGDGGGPDRVLFVGDTRGNDAAAFDQLCRATGWPGIGFIGCETPDKEASWETVEADERILLLAQRWRLLDDLDAFCAARRFPIDGRTAVIVDIDKTALGARGRNDGAIDRARIDAVERTLGDLLGQAPSWDACQRIYARLNHSSLHRWTADNQDVVAYLAMVVVANAFPAEVVLREDVMARFPDLVSVLAEVDRHLGALPAAAVDVHRRFRGGVARSAPPEFDAFRRNEYAATVDRMALLPDDATREERLANEITITEEVRAAALRWRDRGALIVGLSDKPDAASLPTEAMAEAGRRPLHRTEARVVGPDSN